MKKGIMYRVWLVSVSVCVLISGSLRAQSDEWSAAKERQTYQVSGFSGIRVSLPAYVRLEQGTAHSVEGESSEEGLLARVKVVLDGSNLALEADKSLQEDLQKLRKQPVLRFVVRTPRIEDIVLEGSGDVVSQGMISTPRLRVLLQGSGDIKLQTVQSGGEVNAHLNGSGDVEIGKLHALRGEFSLRGSGDLDVDEATVQDGVQLSLQGSGDLKMKRIQATSMDVSLQGSGDIKLESINLSGNYSANLHGSGDLEVRHLQGAKQLSTNLLGSCAMTYGRIEAQEVMFRLRGSGDIIVQQSGKAQRAVYNLTSSGDINAEKLVADEVEVSATGSGDITLHAVRLLNITSMTGSCTVGYRGNPQVQFAGSGALELRQIK